MSQNQTGDDIQYTRSIYSNNCIPSNPIYNLMKHTTKLIHSLGCFSLLHYAYSIIEINKLDFNYPKLGLNKGEYILTFKSNSTLRKNDLILIETQNQPSGKDFRMVKHISSEYVKRGGESMYVRIPQGFIVVTDEEGNTEDIFVSSILGKRHFKMIQFDFWDSLF